MKRCLLYILTASLLCGCHFRDRKSGSDFPKPFPDADMPAVISSQDDFTEYLADRFWNRYLDSAEVWSRSAPDTLYGGISSQTLNKAATEYVTVLWTLPTQKAVDIQRQLMKKCEQKLLTSDDGRKIYTYLTSFLEKVLYGPMSDFRNEDFYLPVIESLLASGTKDSLTRTTYELQLKHCRLNTAGSIAADFSFRTKDGRQYRLHEIDSDLILILFSNPGCPACRHSREMIEQSGKLARMIEENRIRLLNLYIDEDLESWFRSLDEYPEEWMSGYNDDFRVRGDEIYDIRAIPYLMLLDRDKKVLYKDISINMLMMKAESLPLY